MIKIFTYIQTALVQLVKNKGRSILTMLGIIIGIGSVIFIMTLGESAKNFLLSQFSQFGTNVIEVGMQSSMGLDSSADGEKLTLDDVQALKDSAILPELTDIAAGDIVSETFEYKKEKLSANIYGDSPAVFTVNNFKIIQGRAFNASDVASSAKVVVLDGGLAEEVFGTENPVGQKVKIGGRFMRVVGVTEKTSFGPGSFGFQMAYMPISTVKQLFGEEKNRNTVSYMLIQFNKGTDAVSFQNRLSYELRRLHNITDEAENPFMVFSRDQAIRIMDTVLLGIQGFVSAVAGISLLVGGIGIMNIMLVTVKERTKEIGLRKAIGAKNNTVLFQFLIESVVLTTIGGIVGIALGLGLSFGAVALVNVLQPDWGVAFVFVPSALIIACGVSVTIGIIFGLYPAIKAAKLHPIEALRYE
ncbi:MAG: hypothetical protein A2233_03240 [Candidatus Kerfeldbacteria bacterium RIFOXYA2_FULL_38_24]|uniref:Multidrug ABC transporter substrate-binding protein n=1 Tax=Candidatus Kerfeldbacteria bacterium RIFOXYB2_FULL_38_14 TaxID=1798547 RepID=A0A1G2BB95_9BACT|nr:MAG: hypothetical protein A2233_03240 [Candidatus Kerfeldbacteria bacterium RIFOXYA2_FULL_38_24]OGY86434.1 MAG: hypothetical protein A2319_01280 [Candidatus Kerfeldbacteria bacterium RIFOXYB2_FULL_38_14]OGY88422.1 MAG: hypothetical protein A2458_03040 [Candidatus Kerfeldbacteria bacterium RIFOXYC2_FULL_38_9]